MIYNISDYLLLLDSKKIPPAVSRIPVQNEQNPAAQGRRTRKREAAALVPVTASIAGTHPDASDYGVQ